jgi:hypothetical protein
MRYLQVLYLNRLLGTIGIATDYELDGQGSIANRSKIFLFSIESILDLGSTLPPIQWVPREISPGLTRLGSEAHHSVLN